jgi:hypothetical protein
MMFRKVALLASTVCLALAACAQPVWKEGGLYSVATEKGDFSVVKLLKLESNGVHISVYSNRFPQRPSDVDVSKLYMAGIHSNKPDDELGMQDLPLLRQSFSGWEPQLIKVVPVEPAELEAYEMWKAAHGGYF